MSAPVSQVNPVVRE